ncbi:MAG TPA: hypothetical protein VGF14_05725 [Alphaproteobacteria bacterium]
MRKTVTKKIMTKLAVAALGSLLVLGCSTGTPEPRPMPVLGYHKYPQVRLNVGRIEVVNNYNPGQQPGHIENQMAMPLPDAVNDWAKTRFQAMGQDGVLTITIDNASVISENLQRTSGVKGVFTIDQSQRVTGQIALRFASSNASFGTSGNAQVSVKSSRTMAEDSSLQTQDIILANLTDNMMVELDAATQRVFVEKLPSLMQQGGVR